MVRITQRAGESVSHKHLTVPSQLGTRRAPVHTSVCLSILYGDPRVDRKGGGARSASPSCHPGAAPRVAIHDVEPGLCPGSYDASIAIIRVAARTSQSNIDILTSWKNYSPFRADVYFP